MSDFDEKSGAVSSRTEWGHWFQTLEEVYIEINVNPGTKSKDIKCNFQNKHLHVSVKGQGEFPEPIHGDDGLWTLEDGKIIRICLSKTFTTPDHCWKSLLVGQYEANPLIHDEMQKKLTLESFQNKNPGFDFSNASVSGNYQNGGPDLP
ncbi:hypothetical protein LOTGIDRAFT_153375 [Lottia gigantea]|uniref:CS domain-containing protein n=1 Tax=Lottia gigantea TaxID=225164 RepID=V4BXT6_LOTGI|nr:hypothetical protein LOTGIDRAFT_153375 [Lottia gigantea]ESO93904.1 hypothetical protein LOTGIDRAFT_153375 [Lottia gigantea]